MLFWAFFVVSLLLLLVGVGRREQRQIRILPVLDLDDQRVDPRVDLRLRVGVDAAGLRGDEDAAEDGHDREEREVRQPRRVHRAVVVQKPPHDAARPAIRLFHRSGPVARPSTTPAP